MPRKPNRLTKAQLSSEADIQLRDNARVMLQKWFVAVNRNIEAGDNKTIEMVGRMFQYDKGPGGITIFNQHMQVNAAANADAPARVRSFDQIIAKLEETDNMARANRGLLLESAENSEEDDDIEDGETEDVEPAQES